MMDKSVAESCEEFSAMTIHIIQNRTTPEQIKEMLEELGTYIKLAVDVGRNLLAGGGGYNADCKEALIEDGSLQEEIWGADWHPVSEPWTSWHSSTSVPVRAIRGWRLQTRTCERRSK
jgi:hypothetical protein